MTQRLYLHVVAERISDYISKDKLERFLKDRFEDVSVADFKITVSNALYGVLARSTDSRKYRQKKWEFQAPDQISEVHQYTAHRLLSANDLLCTGRPEVRQRALV
jgi:hypothetical protein